MSDIPEPLFITARQSLTLELLKRFLAQIPHYGEFFAAAINTEGGYVSPLRDQAGINIIHSFQIEESGNRRYEVSTDAGVIFSGNEKDYRKFVSVHDRFIRDLTNNLCGHNFRRHDSEKKIQDKTVSLEENIVWRLHHPLFLLLVKNLDRSLIADLNQLIAIALKFIRLQEIEDMERIHEAYHKKYADLSSLIASFEEGKAAPPKPQPETIFAPGYAISMLEMDGQGYQVS